MNTCSTNPSQSIACNKSIVQKLAMDRNGGGGVSPGLIGNLFRKRKISFGRDEMPKRV